MLAHDINQGYQDMMDLIVSEVNGKKIGCLGDVVHAIKKPVGSYHIIKFNSGEVIALNAVEVELANNEILKRYGVERDSYGDFKKN